MMTILCFQMSLLYFGLSVSVAGLVGGQTSASHYHYHDPGVPGVLTDVFMFTDVPAFCWAQCERCRTSGGSDQCKPTLLGRGETWEGPKATTTTTSTARTLGFARREEGGGEVTAEHKFHTWQFGGGALASQRVHRHLR